MDPYKSLAPHTGKVFETISCLECIKPFTLVGGTALELLDGYHILIICILSIWSLLGQ